MPEDRPTVSAGAVLTALREPRLFLGAGLSVLLFLAVGYWPILGFFTGFLAPAPLIYYYYRRGRTFGLTMVGLAVLAVALVYAFRDRPAGGLPFLEYCLLAVVMAEGLRARFSPGLVVGASALSVFLLGLALVAGSGLIRGEGAWSGARDLVEGQVRYSLAMFAGLAGEDRPEVEESGREPVPETGEDGQAVRDRAAGEAAFDLDSLIRTLVDIFPAMVLMGAVFLAWANLLLIRALIARTGGPPPAGYLKTWQAPERLVWVLIAVGFATYFFSGRPRVWAVNLLLILGLVYFFQGLSVVAFWLDKKSAPPFLRTLIYLVIALQQYLAVIVAALGLFDLWLDFRKLKTAGEPEV
ncbi:MAG: YybS family protein [Thermodesulfobacteriota bacterium]